MEEMLSLTANYCTGPERNNTQIGMPSTTSNDVVSLYLPVMEVVEKISLGGIFWGLLVVVVAILGFVGRCWSQNTPMNPFCHYPSPY